MTMRTIFFDVDGVLIHGYHARPELRQCWDEHLERDFGIDRKLFEKEFIFGPFIGKVIIGKQDLHEALSETLPSLGYYDDPQNIIDYWLRNDANINHPLIKVVKHLKQSGHVKLLIATNQEHNRARYLMNELGFADYFDDILYSAKAGALKPEKAYFDYILEHNIFENNAPPILFDDRRDIIDAARKIGWEAHEYVNINSLHENPFVKKLLSDQ